MLPVLPTEFLNGHFIGKILYHDTENLTEQVKKRAI